MRLELALVWTLTLMVKWANTQQSSDGSSKEALLKIARDYRDGADGVQKSPLRAARFYEFIIDRSSNSGENTTSISDATAEFELSELLVKDPTLSAKHSYLTTLIRAAAGGHPEAQRKLSVAYGTGIAARDIVPMDAGRAVFLEYMSALSGNVLANMGMGYRYFQGIGVAESCDASLPHYEFAANVAAQAIEEQGLQITQPDTLKLSEANDPAGKWSKRESTQELTDYYAQLAEQGDVMAALTLGNMLLVGTRMAPANITRALHFLDLAAEANNPSAAGLQGYVMLQQHLHAARREATLHNGDLAMAQRFSQSENSEATIAKVLRLLRLAGKKNDVNGVLGLGLAYFHGVGVSANLTKAVEHIQRAVGVHVDAGYYLGEICMGLQSMELSVTSQFSRSYATSNSDDVTTDGIVKGKNVMETRMIENHMIRQAQNKKIIDTAAATRGYLMSAQMGHVLAQHRLAHLQKRGLGGPFNCKETARLFKAVAERGPWMEQLAEAHAMYTEGNNLRAMYLFAQLAAVGVESAQYNAAYLVSKCTLCPPMDKEASLIGLAGVHSQSSASGSDPLERQHRLKHQSAETNFRLLLKDHEDREKSEKKNNEEALAPNAEPAYRHAPNVQTNQRPSAPVAHDGSFAHYTPSNAAFLPSKEWRGFVMMYNTFHLSEQSDQELEDSLPVDHIESMKDSCRVMRKQLCETRALTLFDLSAQQGNAEAYVQIGDMYYYQRAGLTYPGRKKEAAEFYQRAADLHHTQAIFNLGIMHEVGDGVRQDFHLAKRFYDQAAEVDSKARAPRDIALLMLEGHKTYHALFGAEATTHLLALKVPLLTQSFLSSTGWTVQMYTLWQVIEKIVALETELRGLIDRWVMRYHLHVLHPVRDVLDLLTAPLQRFQPVQAWKHEAHNAPQDNAAPAFKVEHSLRGYAKLVSSFPEYAKSLYDKAFDAVYLLLYYLIRGKPHPALSDRHLNTHDIHALREELLLLILLCMVFCMVLSFKVVRRRLNEAVHEQRPHNQRA